jgi:hypothetical protein
MCTYHCHTTKHVHVPLSQNKTCARTTDTKQNMCTYHYHATKHVGVPLSQYKICARTTVTIQNMCTYHCQYKTCSRTTRYRKYSFHNTGFSACFAGWRVLSLQTCQPAIQRCGNLTFRSCYFSNWKRLDDTQESVSTSEQRNSMSVYTSCFSLHFTTRKRILIAQLTFLNINYLTNNSSMSSRSTVSDTAIQHEQLAATSHKRRNL